MPARKRNRRSTPTDLPVGVIKRDEAQFVRDLMDREITTVYDVDHRVTHPSPAPSVHPLLARLQTLTTGVAVTGLFPLVEWFRLDK